MLQNNLKIAWRSLWKHKSISIINLAGLAIGLATCLLIMLFVQHELSYDRFHEKADRIVRVYFQGTVQGERMNEAHVMPPVAQALKSGYPEVEDATRLRQYGYPQVVVGEQSFRDEAFAFVDANFFSVFTFPLIKGDVHTALKEPYTIVISQKAAAKYFGTQDPIGKELRFKGWDAGYRITGVVANIPENSQFQFDLFASMASLPEARESNWMVSEFFTYLVLKKGSDYKALEAKLPQVVGKYMGPQLQQAMGVTLAQFRAKGNDIGLYLQPLTDVYLHSDFAYDLGPHGDIRYVWIFSAIAVFMLLIACINFMNLSTAGATRRAREVGVRKVIGSRRSDLVRQFLLESVLMATISLVFAIGLVESVLPLFNHLAGASLPLAVTANPWLLPGLLLLGVGTGVLAGSYPAFFLSGFQPGTVLKGAVAAGKKHLGLRSGLVIFQFFLSVSLMICTTVVYQQLRFMQDTPLGYDRNAVLILPETGALGPHEETFRQYLRQDPRVLHLSTSGYLPAGPSYNNNFFLYGDGQAGQFVKTLRYDVDEQYIPTLGIEMAAGRNFSKEMATDSAVIIINETAARAFGWKNNALDHTLTTQLRDKDHEKTYRVVGVVKDFHFRSLHERISPLVMVRGDNQGPAILKVKTSDIPGLLSTLKTRWTGLTDEPFDYSFLDDRVYNTYRAERKFGLILGIFAALTIFVACMGLFGLAIFSAEQRTKEIGVRKVLGASAAAVVGLLSRDFLKPVLVALIIASPLAYSIMHRWLEDFAYRITISAWVFVLAGAAAVAVAFLTVSVQSVKAALRNPVEALRSE